METIRSHRPPVLPAPRVWRLLTLSMLARTPEAAVGLLLILRVRELSGSYALAGLVSGALGAGMAIGGPLLGRLIDRRGQTRVLLATAAAASAALVVAAGVPAGTPAAVLLPMALVAGLCAPPIAACLRSLFGRMPDGRDRHGALAMDAAMQEISFTAGPLVFVTVLGAVSASAGLAAAAASLLAGTLAFAASPESRGVPGSARPRPRWGALHAGGVRTLLAASLGVGAMFGATEVALTSVAERHGGATTLGLLVVVWSVPSLVAGLVVARRPAPRDLPRALLMFCAAAALLTAGLALMPDLASTAVLLAAAGAIAAPLFTAIYSLAAATAPDGTLTEAYTWLGSGLFAGLASGSALGGLLISASGSPAAFVAGGVAAACAALAVDARTATLSSTPVEVTP